MHHWKFFRSGELDQVALESGADLLNLEHLDPKLWVALSCPVKGLELDEKTLALIDADGDGRIRVPELIAAIQWAAARLNEPGHLLKGEDGLPLAAVNIASEGGRVLQASARQILANLGRKDAVVLTVEEAADTAKIFGASALNGDGVIPPEATEDAAVQALIKDIVACQGGMRDRTGSTGVTAEAIEAFFGELSAYVGWIEQSAAKEIAVLGEATDAAVAALRTVRPKVEDFFGRCRLAAFDPRATVALNRAQDEYLAIAAHDLKITADEVAGFPLARVEAGGELPLLEKVNPAWAAALATLHRVVVGPVLGAGQHTLNEAEWMAINARFAAYETWLGGKVGSTVEKLGVARVKEILAGTGRSDLAALVAQDKALEPEYKAINDVERLTRYYRDLRTLLHNFVNFADFYSRDRLATFQAGTLYLDSRSTELCLRVDGPHPLAAMGKMYLAYCACTRAGSEAMNIAAAFTQGDSDYLFVGRHGVFYDRQGRDWDAIITSLVDNPISLRQAFWSPYKKFVRLIDEMVAKRAAAADAVASDRLAAAAKLVANADKAAAEKAAAQSAATAPKLPAKIDVGAVAAISVGVGAIGGALAAVGSGLAHLAWWQYPLVVVGLILVISIPAVIIAWIKLRQRTLGPILDANGWAINGRVKINIPFGTALTEMAVLPPGSRRSLADPYEDKNAAAKQRQLILLSTAVLVAAIVIRLDHNRRGHYFWQSAPAPVVAPVAPAAPDAPAK